MSTYAIGDVQGCLDELRALLKLIRFNSDADQLWFAGDLVNRGPDSLNTLRFIRELGDNAVCVLGNHDLHLLAVAHGTSGLKKSDTLSHILMARDRLPLLDWLHTRHMFYMREPWLLVHAGIPPCWDVDTAIKCAGELEDILRSESAVEFFRMMYGNEPSQWHAELSGFDRLRFTTNALTRMRLCHADGRLDFDHKEAPGQQPSGLLPWFEIDNPGLKQHQVLFGHWAALQGELHGPQFFALDTGCVWGGRLTALRLEDGHRFSVPSHQPA